MTLWTKPYSPPILLARVKRNRGIQGSDFYVLKENSSPAILIELGFTSNEDDEKRMNSAKFQAKTQQGIVDGIIEYFN